MAAATALHLVSKQILPPPPLNLRVVKFQEVRAQEQAQKQL